MINYYYSLSKFTITGIDHRGNSLLIETMFINGFVHMKNFRSDNVL